ncbi:MAG: PilZ domain-containing protein [Pyrinomonadaceae bacterium]
MIRRTELLISPPIAFRLMLLLDDEQRKQARRLTKIDATVEGRIDRMSAWQETTPLVDVSALGAAFTLERQVKRGCLVLVSLAMPREMRGFDFRSDSYKVWALVRRCVPIECPEGNIRYSIGVAFVGKEAPSDHFDNPRRRYELASEEPVNGFWKFKEISCLERKAVNYAKARKQRRYEIPEEVVLELLDGSGETFAFETTVTINISQNGAAVYSQLAAVVGSMIRVSFRQSNLRLISIVRGVNTGGTGLSRINLEFIDQSFPINVL